MKLKVGLKQSLSNCVPSKLVTASPEQRLQAAVSPSEYVFSGHAAGCVEPATAKKPAATSVQEADPTVEVYFPPSHGTHEFKGVGLYIPAGQGMHTLRVALGFASGFSKPAAHGTHSLLA